MISDAKFLQAAPNPATAEEVSQVMGLAQRIDKAVASHGWAQSGFFIKLSTRSPKDSKIVQERIQRQLQQPTDSSDDQYRASIHVLRCQRGTEALDLLLLSQRVEEDLTTQLQFSEQENALRLDTLSLIVRQWEPSNPLLEIRGFVSQGRLTALTQYVDDRRIPFLLHNAELIRKLISQFYDTRAKQCLAEIGIHYSIVDFSILTDQQDKEIKDIRMIELNSFGFRSGAGLFSWDDQEDYTAILHGDLVLRVKRDP